MDAITAHTKFHINYMPDFLTECEEYENMRLSFFFFSFTFFYENRWSFSAQKILIVWVNYAMHAFAGWYKWSTDSGKLSRLHEYKKKWNEIVSHVCTEPIENRITTQRGRREKWVSKNGKERIGSHYYFHSERSMLDYCTCFFFFNSAFTYRIAEMADMRRQSPRINNIKVCAQSAQMLKMFRVRMTVNSLHTVDANAQAADTI